MPKSVSERTLLLLIAAVQCVNILDFVMVMPLGPDFAAGLGIPESRLGLLAASYTAAAGIAGFLGSFFLERFDRRRALGVAMFGLSLGTALGGFAHDFRSLVIARVVAGVCGGPATSLSLSIIADGIPPARRGRALGAVMGAFSVANVLGLPLALKVAQAGSWRMPFFGLAAVGFVTNVAVLALLPPMREHLRFLSNAGGFAGAVRSTFALLRQRQVVLSYSMTAVTMSAGFLIVPNIPAYLLHTLHLPRSRLDLVYLLGGFISFGTLRLMGRWVDRIGPYRVGTVGSLMFLVVLYLAFMTRLSDPRFALPLAVGFFLALGTRNVAYSTLTSRVPRPQERARFMSLQSTVQHAASAAGAALSSRLLVGLPDHSLGGLPRLAAVSMALTLPLPVFLRAVERAVVRSEASGPSGPGLPAVPAPPSGPQQG